VVAVRRIAVGSGHGGARVLLVVGHNPGISELGCELAGLGSHARLPTASFRRRSLDAQSWQALADEAGPDVT